MPLDVNIYVFARFHGVLMPSIPPASSREKNASLSCEVPAHGFGQFVLAKTNHLQKCHYQR